MLTNLISQKMNIVSFLLYTSLISEEIDTENWKHYWKLKSSRKQSGKKINFTITKFVNLY